jgi:hypothetical protein
MPNITAPHGGRGGSSSANSVAAVSSTLSSSIERSTNTTRNAAGSRKRRFAAKLLHRAKGTQIRILQRVLGVGLVTQCCTRQPVEPAVVAAHELECRLVASSDAGSQRPVIER